MRTADDIQRQFIGNRPHKNPFSYDGEETVRKRFVCVSPHTMYSKGGLRNYFRMFATALALAVQFQTITHRRRTANDMKR